MNDFTQNDGKNFWFRVSQKAAFGGMSFLIGAFSIFIGVPFAFLPGSTIFDSHQGVVLNEINKHLMAASTSTTVAVAARHLSEATDELDQYVKIHPLAEDSSDNFQDWHKQILGVSHSLALAEQVEKSPASPLEKLQAEEIAFKSLRDEAEIKITNMFGANLGTEYNVPNSIPIKLNAVEQVICNYWGLFFFIGVVAIFLGMSILAFDDET